jgi:hypothetical protein
MPLQFLFADSLHRFVFRRLGILKVLGYSNVAPLKETAVPS